MAGVLHSGPQWGFSVSLTKGEVLTWRGLPIKFSRRHGLHWLAIRWRRTCWTLEVGPAC